jgi:hypothetical protein
MVTTIRGRIQGGVVIPDAPLDLPDGLEVEVRITSADPANASQPSYGPVIDSVFGMWRGRDDMADSVAWVRKQRDEWQNRLTHDQE